VVRVARGRPRPGIGCILSERPVTLKGVGSQLAPRRGTSRAFASHPSTLLHLRASDGVEARQERTALRRFVLHRMGRYNLRPSNEPRYGMRLHGYVASL